MWCFGFFLVLFCFCFVFVLFFFFAWKDKTCLVISFTSDVHVYTITSKCPPADYRKRNDFSRHVARIDLGGGGSGPQKVGLFEPHPLSLLQKTHFVAKSGSFGRFGGCIVPSHPLTAVILLFIYLLILLLHAWLSLLSKSSIYPWASNKKIL